ncbi:MAG: bifunctional diaminohydroxyphosphoribosylaminopyrimidine deaminase/5-amino-6-(5-phosphoribosylamino)uracil reductase RibD [Actinomycetota bacterium]
MHDTEAMEQALEQAASVRATTSPNPWVGAVVIDPEGRVVGEGATEPPPGRHAEAVALAAAGDRARGATVAVTLEPCSHHGRTPPCADALVEAGVARVVVGIADPDPVVAGRGIERLRAAGIEVEVGVAEERVEAQLTPYLKHRRTGRPWVVCKLASTVDGRTAAADGSSQWITGEDARRDAHRLRAESDAVLVGAGTVRDDDPSLTVRLVEGDDPRRVVLGEIPQGAAVLPATSMSGDLGAVLDRLGDDGVLQVMVEGGASVAGEFHRAGLVDQYVLYVAPALMGGDDGVSLLAGSGAPTIAEAWRGRFRAVTPLGPDLRIDLEPLPVDAEAA